VINSASKRAGCAGEDASLGGSMLQRTLRPSGRVGDCGDTNASIEGLAPGCPSARRPNADVSCQATCVRKTNEADERVVEADCRDPAVGLFLYRLASNWRLGARSSIRLVKGRRLTRNARYGSLLPSGDRGSSFIAISPATPSFATTTYRSVPSTTSSTSAISCPGLTAK
jgi:hypothetical protein